MSPYVFGLALACLVELLLASRRIVRKGRANRARFESDLRAIRSEVERIAQVCKATSTSVAATGCTVISIREEMRSQLGNLQDRAQGLVDRVNGLASQITTLSKQVDVVEPLVQLVNALTTEVEEIKQTACEMRSQLANLQDRGEGISDRVNELVGRIETLSGQVDVVKSVTRQIEAVATDAAQIKTDVPQIKKSADQIESRVASIEANVGASQTPAPSTEASTSEINRAPNGEDKGLGSHDIAPEKRGGSPRKPDRGNGDGKPIRGPLPPRPQLVARRDTADWQIYVDVEHETTQALRVVQGEAELNEANGEEPRIFGPLHDLRDPIRILRNGSEPIESALITKDKPALIFRLVQDGCARSVRHPSS